MNKDEATELAREFIRQVRDHDMDGNEVSYDIFLEEGRQTAQGWVFPYADIRYVRDHDSYYAPIGAQLRVIVFYDGKVDFFVE